MITLPSIKGEQRWQVLNVVHLDVNIPNTQEKFFTNAATVVVGGAAIMEGKERSVVDVKKVS